MRTSPLQLQDFLNDEFGGFHAVDVAADSKDDVDIEAIEAAAYERGRAAGVKDAKAAALESIEKKLLETITAITSQAGELEARLEACRMTYLQRVCETLLPKLAELGFAFEAATMLNELVTRMASSDQDAPLIRVATSPEMLQSISAHFDAANSHDYFRCYADEELSGTQLSASWGNGGVEFDVNGVADDILTALQQALETAMGSTDHE